MIMHNLVRDNTVSPFHRELAEQTHAYLPALYRAARCLIPGPAEAETVVLELYCRAARVYREHPDTGGLKGWLFALLWQVCLDTWRRQHAHGIPRVRPSFPPAEASVTALQRVTSDLASQEERTVVRQAIASLPLALRLVVLLVDLEGFSYHDTAAIVRCPVALVASRLHRARQRLAGQLRHLVSPTASQPQQE